MILLQKLFHKKTLIDLKIDFNALSLQEIKKFKVEKITLFIRRKR